VFADLKENTLGDSLK